MTELRAAPHWSTVELLSDLHLHVGDTATFEAWRSYLQTTQADAVLVLGDLFDVWVGDDALTSASTDPATLFARECVAVVREAATRMQVFVMHGNRDFLLQGDFMRACQATSLADPSVLLFAGQRWLLTHGDALCLEDVDYQRFRQQVRDPAWQQTFLARPLDERRQIASAIRTESEQRKSSTETYADVDPAAALQWLHAAQAQVLIHGHTHRPAVHALGQQAQRWVLSDWDCQATPPRAEILRLQRANRTPQHAALERVRVNPA